MNRKRINLNITEIKKYYIEDSLYATEIAKKYNCDSNTIIRRLREQNVKIHRNIPTAESNNKRRNTMKRKMGLGYLPTIVGWWKGKKHTKEHSAKISKASIGNKNSLGNHHSEEIKKMISQKLKGRISPQKGAVLSKETKEKMSKSHKEKLLENPERLKRMLRRRIPTSLEEEFQNIINKNNLPYKFVGDGKFFIERYNPDFINTNNEKIAVEVYARYYKLRNNKSIDEWKEDRQKVFKKYGWKIIFFNEVEVNEKNVLEKI